jgi:hypothetical protein
MYKVKLNYTTKLTVVDQQEENSSFLPIAFQDFEEPI